MFIDSKYISISYFIQEDICDNGSCIEWSDWGEWSPCSVTSGKGTKHRSKSCLLQYCSGPTPTEVILSFVFLITCSFFPKTSECNEGPTTQWGEWSPWSRCSKTCGPGIEKRERVCSSSKAFRLGLLTSDCPGASQDKRSCEIATCAEQSTQGKYWRIMIYIYHKL